MLNLLYGSDLVNALEPGLLYRGTVDKVFTNRCNLWIDGIGYIPDVAMTFPYYNVDTSNPADSYGHGIIFKPQIGAHCIVGMIGTDPYIIGFMPAYDIASAEDMVDDVDPLNKQLDELGSVVSQIVKNNNVNVNSQPKKNDSVYSYNDEDLTLGDMALTTSGRNKIIAHSFGINVISATNYCFRIYSKYQNTIREGFRNMYRFFPSGSEIFSNLREQEGADISTNYIKTLKYSYKDVEPIFTQSVGQQVNGFYQEHKAHHSEGSDSFVTYVDLGANVIRSYGDVCQESVGADTDGRSIKARNHTIEAAAAMNINGGFILSVNSIGSSTFSAQGIATLQSSVSTTVKGKIVQINPLAAKKTKNSAASGTQKAASKGMKASEFLGKVKEYAPQLNKTVSQMRAGKVKEAMIGLTLTYGPKIISKAGGVAPVISKVKNGAIAKIGGAVDTVLVKFPEGMRNKAKEAATKRLVKLGTDKLTNLVSNSIAKASGNIITSQDTNVVMAMVASTGPETFDRDDIEFKKEDMGDLMKDEVAQNTMNIVKDATTTPSPANPSTTIMDDGIAEVVTAWSINPYISTDAMNQGLMPDMVQELEA